MFKLPAQKKYLGKIKLLKNKQALFDNFLWQLDDPDKIYSPLKLGVLLQNKFTLFNFQLIQKPLKSLCSSKSYAMRNQLML